MTTQADTPQKAGDRTAELTKQTPSDFSGKLQDRIQKIVDAVNESQKEGLKHEVEIDQIEDSELVSITVEPLTDWTEQGELGVDRCHIILGPRGGVHHSVKSTMFAEKKELHKEKHAFSKTVRRLESLA